MATVETLFEVHERDRNSEFLLIVLRGLLTKRPDLRLVLMSATLQQGKYSAYFGGCPTATIGARTFPVQVGPFFIFFVFFACLLAVALELIES